MKILLDISKESSDWLPPLKSALGGMSALIKHCEVFVGWMFAAHDSHERSQQSEDVREKIEDLIPLLERLKQNVTATTVDGDQAEKQRRSELTRYACRLFTLPTHVNSHCSALGEIERRSQSLLEKGIAARFVDKGEDSKEVAGLVERLRGAIILYQVSGN